MIIFAALFQYTNRENLLLISYSDYIYFYFI